MRQIGLLVLVVLALSGCALRTCAVGEHPVYSAPSANVRGLWWLLDSISLGYPSLDEPIGSQPTPSCKMPQVATTPAAEQ